MNILLINHYAGSPLHGMEYRPYYLAKEWAKEGHNITIIAASYSHLRIKQPEIKKPFEEEIIDGINYLWIKTPEYKGNRIRRIINILTFTIRLLLNYKKINEKIKPDVIVASSPHPFVIYPSYLFSKISKSKLIFEVRDLWPLSLVELGNISKYNPFIVLLQIAEDFAYKKADKVVSLLPKTLDYMILRGMKKEKFVYIPNGINIEEWENLKEQLPEEHINTLEKLKNEGNFLVCYAGSHGIANALEYLVESAKYIKDLSIKIILVGQGPEKENLIKYSKNNNLENLLFLPAIPKNSIPSLLKYMDCLYIGWQKISLYRFGVSANKIFDYMISGKPIIHAVEAGNDPVKEANCGLTITPENPQAITDAIKKLYYMKPIERQQMGENGREYVIKNHDYKKLAKKFIEIVK